MGILDDTAIFAAVLRNGGFSHAAKYLGLSNGLVSRRIAELEADLGVTLLKRTTRQIHLTPEGELLWQHAQRIQQELDSALSLIKSSSTNAAGIIRVSAPPYFGRHYLTPILIKFMRQFNEIKIDLNISPHQFDLVKEQLDLVIRGAGYIEETKLQDSNLQMKLLLKEKIGLYASPDYLSRHQHSMTCATLHEHNIIYYSDDNHLPEQIMWKYLSNQQANEITLKPGYHVNDIESSLTACIEGYGIGKFTELHVKDALNQKLLQPILNHLDWGNYHLYAIYPQQYILPKRTRLLLDFIYTHLQTLITSNQ